MKATITDISFVFKILCNEVKKNDMKYTALIVNLFDEQHLALCYDQYLQNYQ